MRYKKVSRMAHNQIISAPCAADVTLAELLTAPPDRRSFFEEMMLREQVMGLLGLKGKEVGEAMEHVTDWQLGHPSGTSAECQEWLRAKYEKSPEH